MPILVLIASTAAFWLMYWFVRMGGLEHVCDILARRDATARKAKAREIERAAPLRAVEDPRDAAIILMVLMARVDHDPLPSASMARARSRSWAASTPSGATSTMAMSIRMPASTTNGCTLSVFKRMTFSSPR